MDELERREKELLAEMAAYEAGKNYAKNGANTDNCSFRHFATEKRTKAWERGRDEIGSRNGS